MQISEKELQDKVFDYGVIDSRKFNEGVEITHSEFTVSDKRFDLIGVGFVSNTLYIIELKAGVVDANALCQLLEYISISSSSMMGMTKCKDIRGILIGSSVDDRVESVIKKIDNVEVMTYSFDVEIDNDVSYDFKDEYLQDVYKSIEKILPDKYKLEGE